MNDRLKRLLAAGSAVAALGLGGAAIAGAAGGHRSKLADRPAAEAGDNGKADKPGDNSKKVTGSALEKASAIALDRTGGGRVTDSEVRDEEGYYEIEVTRNDGSQVDVHLDSNFRVIDQSADGSGSH
jgi:uncharacterized membrane protein YkoI